MSINCLTTKTLYNTRAIVSAHTKRNTRGDSVRSPNTKLYNSVPVGYIVNKFAVVPQALFGKSLDFSDHVTFTLCKLHGYLIQDPKVISKALMCQKQKVKVIHNESDFATINNEVLYPGTCRLITTVATVYHNYCDSAVWFMNYMDVAKVTSKRFMAQYKPYFDSLFYRGTKSEDIAIETLTLPIEGSSIQTIYQAPFNYPDSGHVNNVYPVRVDVVNSTLICTLTNYSVDAYCHVLNSLNNCTGVYTSVHDYISVLGKYVSIPVEFFKKNPRLMLTMVMFILPKDQYVLVDYARCFMQSDYNEFSIIRPRRTVISKNVKVSKSERLINHLH